MNERFTTKKDNLPSCHHHQHTNISATKAKYLDLHLNGKINLAKTYKSQTTTNESVTERNVLANG